MKNSNISRFILSLISSVSYQSERRARFTLVELLVVIAIIAILAGMLMPALKSAIENGKATSCLSNQKQCMTGILMYAGDYGDHWICFATAKNPPTTGNIGTPWDLYAYHNNLGKLNYFQLTDRNSLRRVKTYCTAYEDDYYWNKDISNDNCPPYLINASNVGYYSNGGNVAGCRNSAEKYTTRGITTACIPEASKFAVLVCPRAPNKNNSGTMLERAFQMHCKANPVASDKWAWNTDAHNKSSNIGFADGHAAKFDYRQITWGMTYLDKTSAYKGYGILTSLTTTSSK